MAPTNILFVVFGIVITFFCGILIHVSASFTFDMIEEDKQND